MLGVLLPHPSWGRLYWISGKEDLRMDKNDVFNVFFRYVSSHVHY